MLGRASVDLNVHVKLAATLQTSDMRTVAGPSGGTSRTSRSFACVWLTPCKVTSTSTTGPRSPLTATLEELGVAGPTRGTSIGVALENAVTSADADSGARSITAS